MTSFVIFTSGALWAIGILLICGMFRRPPVPGPKEILMESDAQRILNHDADNAFLKACGIGRYDNEQAIRFHLERAEVIREQMKRNAELICKGGQQ